MSSNKSQPPKVFISYSWDSQEHKDRVLDLADQLRRDGIDCNIDQFEVSPSVGWPNWMLNQVEESDFVLLVCTEKYYRRYRGRENPGEGQGVVWEGAIISQFIYDQQSNDRFIPVIFDPQAGNYIPYEIKKYTYYLLNRFNFNLKEPGYEALYRHLTDQSQKKGSLGKTVSLPRRPHYPHNEDNGLLREEEKEKQLENLYNQYDLGKKYYQDKNWFEAYRKFEKILSFRPKDQDFRRRVEQRLGQTQQKIAKEKKISIGIIIASWLVSVWLSIDSIGIFGGFVSGIVVWWVSQWTKPLEPSLKILKLFLFIFIGVFLEFIFWQNLEGFQSPIKDFLVILIGSGISIAVLFWQINNRLVGK